MPKILLYPGVHEYFFNKPENVEVHAILSVSVNCVPLRAYTIEQAVSAYPKLLCDKKPALIWNQTEPPPEELFVAWDYGSLEYSEEVFWLIYNHVHEFFNNVNVFWNTASIVIFVVEERKFTGGTPWGITQINPDKFIVFPIPDDKRPYKIKMVLALKPTRTALGMDEAAFNELEDAIVHGTLQRLLLLPKQKWEDRELASYHAKQYLARITERRARANLTNARATLRVQIPPF